MKKNLLITGGAGFIGSHFIEALLKNLESQSWQILNLDKLTYASDYKQIKSYEEYANYTFIIQDICEREAIQALFQERSIHSVIHFAAESHVDNSILSPRQFLETNILGTHNLLEAARYSWMNERGLKPEFSDSRFHHISTDEVYGSLSFDDPPFTEKTPYAPNSPYSASKASSDFIVRSYYETYGLPVVITNCSNNYGPHQHDEKLIPTIIRKAIQEEPIPLYGDGRNVRDWLYVEDHCEAIWNVFQKSRVGETYNVGGNSEKNNLEVTKTICHTLDKKIPRISGKKYQELISFVKDRPAHDRRYAIDASKIQRDLNWKPRVSFEEGIQKTVSWYIQKYTTGKEIK